MENIYSQKNHVDTLMFKDSLNDKRVIFVSSFKNGNRIVTNGVVTKEYNQLEWVELRIEEFLAKKENQNYNTLFNFLFFEKFCLN